MKKIILAVTATLAVMQSQAQCNSLFISQYVEGSSFNKAIEIYNPTSFNIPLTGVFTLRLYFNGSATPTTIPLTGTINANSTYVIANTSASAPLLALANQTNGGISFNGDDAVELYSNFTSTAVDIIGVIGVDPGSEWLVNGVSGTLDHTLVRMASVQSPTTTWTGVNEMQYTVLGIDDFTGIGSHTMNPCSLPEPTASIVMGDVCDGTPDPFLANVSGGTPGYNYFWDFGDGSPVDNNAAGSHTFPAAGTYNVQLVVIDQNLQDDTATATITIFPNPVAGFTLTGNTANGCGTDTIAFTNMSTGGVSYNWSFGDATSSTAMSPPDKIYNTGEYLISLTVTSSDGCTDFTSDSVIVNSLPNVTLQTNDTTICNQSFGIFLNATGPDGTWTGTFVNDYTNGAGFFSSAAITPGVYYAVYTINNPCGYDTDSVQITVEEPPVAGYTYVLSGGGFTVNFTNTSTGATTYDWDFGGQGVSTQTNPSFTFSSNGTYNVCLDAYSAAGTCSITYCQNITIVGVDEINLNEFSVYPNPSTDGKFTIQFKNASEGTMQVTDVAGKVVYTKSYSPLTTAMVDLSSLGGGLYTLTWQTESGKYSRSLFFLK